MAVTEFPFCCTNSTSRAHTTWTEDRAARLDEMLDLRRRAVGPGAGRKWGTIELNRMMMTKLSAEFQGFCRELHVESCNAIDYHLEGPDPCRRVFKNSLGMNLMLNTKNPRPSTLGSDFGRFGLKFTERIKAADKRNANRLKRLDRLVNVRNAIVHDNEGLIDAERLFTASIEIDNIENLADTHAHRPTTKSDFDAMRSCLGELAKSMDKVLADHVHKLFPKN